MQIIISYIEFLLTQHDCVTIPQLGGFILQPQPASIDAAGRFLAPTKLVSFNSSLVYNDGLLVNLIAVDQQVSYQQAFTQIESFVDTVRQTLAEQGRMELGELGALYYEAGQETLQFVPFAREQFDLYNYGFPTLSIQRLTVDTAAVAPVVEQIAAAADTVNPARPHTSTAYTFNRFVAMIAVALCLSLFSTTPHYESSYRQNHASLVPIPMQVERVAVKPIFAKSIPAITVTPLVAPIIESIELAKPQKRYFIVVGSFPTQEQAQEGVKHLRKQGLTDVSFIQKHGKYRLHTKQFLVKAEAEAFLADFRLTHKQYKDAWLMAHIQ